MAERTALLVGATGLVGAQLLSRLLESPLYRQVTVVARRPVSNTDPKLNLKIVDFDALPEFDPVDDVFCAFGTTIKKAGSKSAFRKIDYEYPLTVARHAAEAGATQFLLVSSVGADRKSSNFYLRTKGELEHALGGLPFRGLHIFQPSLLVGDRQEERGGEKIGIAISRVLGPLMAGPLRKYRAIEAGRLAEAMLEAARNKAEGRRVYLYDDFFRLLNR